MDELTKNKEVFLPDENVTLSFAVTDDKPFNKCFQCHSFRSGCSGPNLSVMGVERVCEFLQMARIFLKKSYQDVADGTGISLATIKRTLTGKVNDPSFFTISSIAAYLLGDPNGKYPCAIPNIVVDESSQHLLAEALKDIERLGSDNEEYKRIQDNIHASYQQEIDAVCKRYQGMIDTLKDELQRAWIQADAWKAENERKAKIIDRNWDKILAR